MPTKTLKNSLTGLYAITDHQLSGIKQLLEDVETTLKNGTRLIQYRDKSNEPEKRLEEAKALVQLCSRFRVPLIINDDIDLAVRVGAQGIHLGKDDQALSDARAKLGIEAIIGISCYDNLNQALDAQNRGADYVAFGRFFSSSSKPEAVQASVELLEKAAPKLSVPIVAIGGITPENGKILTAAGADMLAVIQGIFGQPSISTATKRFLPLFNSLESHST